MIMSLNNNSPRFIFIFNIHKTNSHQKTESIYLVSFKIHLLKKTSMLMQRD